MTISRDTRAFSQHRGALSVRFHPDHGGRVAAVRYAGVDLVLPPGQVPDYYGDTFWPSPQSKWDWPPPPVIDAQPYEVLERNAHMVRMRSGVDPVSGLRVDKRCTLADDTMTSVFTVSNLGAAPVTVAPWQVTRAVRDGLLVWAPGQPFDDAGRLHKQQVDPGCWYWHVASAPFAGYTEVHGYATLPVRAVTQTSKFFTDARGWVAHVHDGVIFLRQFPDLTVGEMAPEQAELELFFGLERDYIELENQGAFRQLEPGQSLAYHVRWRFGHLTAGIPDDSLTPELVDAIRRLSARH